MSVLVPPAAIGTDFGNERVLLPNIGPFAATGTDFGSEAFLNYPSP